MSKYIKKLPIYLFVCLNMFFVLSQTVFATIYTEKSGNGQTDSVYVVGNPDCYPIEYYDAESESYKGIIPDMLNMISKDTGIDFVYIYSGEKNRQKELSANNQAELVTAVSTGKGYDFAEKIPILSYEASNEKKIYYIGFTRVIDEEKMNKIITALSDITESQKTGLLISNSKQPHTYNNPSAVILIACTLLLIFAVIVIVRKKRKKMFHQNDYTDKLTGIGNSDYYDYVFDNLISDKAKNLYSLAYFSFDCAKTEKLYGKNAVPDIEKYIAAKLMNYSASAEYVAHIQTGVFICLFQSENAEKCISRVTQTVNGINQYLSEFNSAWSKFVKAGICRLCDCKDVNSETAFYNAKQGYLYAVSKELPCHIGSEKQLAQTRKTDALRKSVNDDIKNGNFKIYIQLIMDSKTDTFCGGEVLSRWQNSEYGLLRPYEYIDILKENEKIIEHDYNVFEQTCALLQQWNKSQYEDMFLTCNFTRLSVEKKDFVEKLREIAERYNFRHEKLVVEITEDSLNTESGGISKNISECKKLGFKIAIDDMGTGFSSLADIYDNEIEIVKIERSFISSCVTKRRQKMLGDIIMLVHNADAKIICEGVETEQQSEMLKKLGCDMMQGYYYSRVVPLKECERILAMCEKNINS